jgi:hypothetical protein
LQQQVILTPQYVDGFESSSEDYLSVNMLFSPLPKGIKDGFELLPLLG